MEVLGHETSVGLYGFSPAVNNHFSTLSRFKLSCQVSGLLRLKKEKKKEVPVELELGVR